MNTIKSKLVKDGNSTAIRIPKKVLEMSELKGTVDLIVKKGQIIVSRQNHPRDGWGEQIEAVNKDIKASPKTDPELTDWEETIGDGI